MRCRLTISLVALAISCPVLAFQSPPGRPFVGASNEGDHTTPFDVSQENPQLNRLAPSAAPTDLLGSKPRPVDVGLLEAVDNVTETFEKGDAEPLTPNLGPNKIFTSIDTGASRAGYYTRSQLRFMLDKLFHERQTRAFKYAIEDLELADADRAFLRSEWTYMVFDSDTVVTESLRFQFERHRGKWHISEIKASKR